MTYENHKSWRMTYENHKSFFGSFPLVFCLVCQLKVMVGCCQVRKNCLDNAVYNINYLLTLLSNYVSICTMSTTPLKDEMKKQVQQIFLKTLQKHPEAKKKALKDSELRKLAKDLYDFDEASGLLSILPAREVPTLTEYFLWCKQVIDTLTG